MTNMRVSYFHLLSQVVVISSTAEYTLLKEKNLHFSIFNSVCQHYEKSDFQGSQLVLLLKYSFFDCAYFLVGSLRFTRTGEIT